MNKDINHVVETKKHVSKSEMLCVILSALLVMLLFLAACSNTTKRTITVNDGGDVKLYDVEVNEDGFVEFTYNSKSLAYDPDTLNVYIRCYGGGSIHAYVYVPYYNANGQVAKYSLGTSHVVLK